VLSNIEMSTKTKKCFVCGVETTASNHEINKEVNLPVCQKCKGSEKERNKTDELLDSLADGLICGCI